MPRDYVLKPTAHSGLSALQRSYLNYLIQRLTSHRAAGRSFGQHFRVPPSFGVTKKILQGQLGNLEDPAQWQFVMEQIQEKINSTALGLRNASRGTRNYHTLEEHEL